MIGNDILVCPKARRLKEIDDQQCVTLMHDLGVLEFILKHLTEWDQMEIFLMIDFYTYFYSFKRVDLRELRKIAQIAGNFNAKKIKNKDIILCDIVTHIFINLQVQQRKPNLGIAWTHAAVVIFDDILCLPSIKTQTDRDSFVNLRLVEMQKFHLFEQNTAWWYHNRAETVKLFMRCFQIMMETIYEYLARYGPGEVPLLKIDWPTVQWEVFPERNYYLHRGLERFFDVLIPEERRFYPKAI